MKNIGDLQALIKQREQADAFYGFFDELERSRVARQPLLNPLSEPDIARFEPAVFAPVHGVPVLPPAIMHVRPGDERDLDHKHGDEQAQLSDEALARRLQGEEDARIRNCQRYHEESQKKDAFAVKQFAREEQIREENYALKQTLNFLEREAKEEVDKSIALRFSHKLDKQVQEFGDRLAVEELDPTRHDASLAVAFSLAPPSPRRGNGNA